MAIVNRLWVEPSLLDASVQRATTALASDVVRINYSIGEDWSGESAIFFRVVLHDAASQSQLRHVAQRVRSTVLEEVKPEELGLQSYFNFRNMSEQAELREPAWA